MKPKSASRTGDAASQTARAFLGIRELLMRGEFERGERISELSLTERLEMSRTPIRTALERLAHIGLLNIVPTGGFSVRGFTVGEVRDAIELRAVLEGTAARLAAERLTDYRELKVLHQYRDEIDSISELSIDSFAYYMDRNELFHSAIAELAKSAMLKRLLQQSNSLPFASPSAMVFPTSMLSTSGKALLIAQEHHRSIFEAIENREGTRAEHMAREHARLGSRIFETALADESVMNRVPGGSLIDISTR